MRWWVLAALAAAQDSPFPAIAACDGDSAPEYPVATGFLTDASALTLAQVESHHIVGVVPHSAALATGEAAVSAQLYAALPRIPVDGGSGFETAMTKVVLVGVSDDQSTEGFWVPPCGELTDENAVKWLLEAAPKMVNGPPTLAAKADPALANQVPFVDLVLGERKKGGVLPVVMGKQTPQLAQQMGDLLGKIVGSGGPYQQNRVLFLFAADLSRNLEKKWAQPRDAETVGKMVAEGFGSVLTYFNGLKDVQLAGEHRRPVDFAGVLAALKLAENLKLRGAEVRVGSSGDFIGATDRNDLEKVRGYASVLFLRDDRTPGEKLSAAPQMPTNAPTTTTTTTGPTTTPPANTMPPAPFGASPPALLEQETTTRFRRFLRALHHI